MFCWWVDSVGWLSWSVSPSTVGRSVGRFLSLVGEFVGGSINRGCMRRIWLGLGFLVVRFLHKINLNNPRKLFAARGKKVAPQMPLLKKKVNFSRVWVGHGLGSSSVPY